MSSDESMSLDQRAVRRSFSAAGERYDAVAVLQKEVRERLLERLNLFKLQPSVVLDVGCGTAHSSHQLKTQYPSSTVIALDAALGMLQHANASGGWLGSKWFGGKKINCVCADAMQLPLKSASVDLVFSNLMLQWCDPPDKVFSEVRRVLKPDGVFIFSSFGPDTLRELRNAWSKVDSQPHVNTFIDMHDLGDAMMRAGLAEPVLDIERFTLTYPDALSLMRELKAIGAHNVAAHRQRGMTGKSALNQVIAAYEQYRQNEMLPATYEVVYGQAWGNAAPQTLHRLSSEVRIPLSDIGRRTR